MKRRFTVRYEDTREPVENETVYLVNNDNKRFKSKTNRDGEVSVDFPWEVIRRLEVGPHTVREDWYIGDQDHLEDVYVENPDKGGYDDAGVIRGIRGRVFWHDGTTMDNQLPVSFETASGFRHSTDQSGGFIKADGSFYIPLIGSDGDKDWMGEIKYWFVGGDEIRYKQKSGPAFYMLVMEHRFGGGHSDRGGIITGRVVDKRGDPVEGAKITGVVSAGSLFGRFLSTPEDPEARTGKGGRFSLVFSGGSVLKTIYVEGDEPERAYRLAKDRETEIPLPTRDIKAGTFGVYLVCPNRRIFGGFF